MATQARRIVLTGATGMIGRELVRRLAERGDHVTVLSRDPDRARRGLPQAHTHYRWSSSMTDGEWASALDGADGVINLAGAPVAKRWTDKHKQAIRSSRIDGTRNLVDAMGRAGSPPATLISASGVGYYGLMRTERLTEESSPGNDFLARVCAEWEKEAMRGTEHGIRVVTVRTGIVLDPGGGALARLLTPFRLFVGGPLSSGRQPFPWIHIADEVGIYLWALDHHQVQGPINAAAPGIVSNREFSRTLGKVMHRPSAIPVPELALRILFGEGATVITGGQNVIPEKLLNLRYPFAFPSLDPALRDLLDK